MRWGVLLACAAIAACTFDASVPAADDTAIDAATTATADAATAVTADADLASVDAAPNGAPDATLGVDTDLDGLDDSDDNCVMIPNPDQYDEDVDGRGDDCDNCPHISNSDQNDTGDSDGIGDACDPRPNTAGDVLLHFDGFNGTTLSDDWVLRSGPNTWTVAGGVVEHQAASQSIISILAWTGAAPAAVAIHSSHEYVSVSGFSQAGPITSNSANGGDAWSCYTLNADGGSDVWIARITAASGVAQSISALTAGTLYRTRFARDETAGDMRCGLDASEQVELTRTDPALQTGSAGLNVFNGHVRFHYVAIYSR